MRIHELLEACIEYIVVEGVLGADPRRVREHIQSLNPKVDEAYFRHLWTLLARHAAVQIVVTADPLPGVKEEELLVRPDNVELFTVLGVDDGGSPPIKTSDLAGLLERYPDRLRIRCTEEEIFYRLTGSRSKIHRITPMIFTYLQLAARTREKGISAVELGPMTDSNQKSVYHYMKVLCQLGLCAKIPASMHGANTSVLVFRKYLDQNPNYQAHMRPLKAEPEEPEPEASRAVAEEGGDGADEVQGLGFDFAPFSEIELVAGHVPKERLLKVLDHPALKNHLLGNHHLMQVIGWPEELFRTRHRRQLQRHIQALVEQGVVEYVDIGSAKRACLRLTKYNPDFVPESTAGPATLSDLEEIKEVTFSADNYGEPFQYHGGALKTRSVEAQVLSMIQEAGHNGQTLAAMCMALSGLYKRTLDHIVNRQDLVFLPPHLRHGAIRLVMESHQRERRLRVFTTDAYHQYLLQLGMPAAPPPTWTQAGHFADLTYRKLASSAEEYRKYANKLAAPVIPIGKVTVGRPKGAKSPGRPNTRNVQSTEPKSKKKAAAPGDAVDADSSKFKYKNDVQERGRPRKYIYVVDLEGKRNRPVLGDLLTSPELPQVLIYLKEEGVLVPAPAGYTGVGKPPPLSEQQIAEGKPPSYYLSVAKSGPKKGGKKAAKAKAPAKGKGKRKAAQSEDEIVDEADLGGDEVIEVDETSAGPSKRMRTVPQTSTTKDDADPFLETSGATTTVDAETTVGAEPATMTAGPSDTMATPTPAGRPKRTRAKPEAQKATEVASDVEPPQKRSRRGRASSTHEAAAGVAGDATAEVAEQAQSGQPATDSSAAVDDSQNGTALPSSTEVPDSVLQFFADAAVEMEARDNQQQAAAPPLELTQAESRKMYEELGLVPSAAESNAAVAQTPAKPTIPQLPSVTHDTQEDVLRSIEDEKPAADTPARGPGRVDIAIFRRMNELMQCLTDLGGVFSEPKLWHEHKEWAQRNAGTDHPNAPPRGGGGGMDRKVFRRTVNKLLEEGRVKERNVTIPTTTGRWIKMMVVFLADKPADEINTYIRHLANTAMAPPTTPNNLRSKAQLEYSAYKRSAPRPSLKQEPGAEEAQTPTAARGGLTPREVYLSEPGMFGYLLGFVSGRAVRAKNLHCAAIKAFESNLAAESVVSSSPRIVSLPFLYEELLLKDYLSIYQVATYDEEVYDFCQTPANLELKLSELPKNISDKINLTGRSAQSAKNAMRALLSLLSFLQLVTPLVPTADEALGTIHITGDPKAHPVHYLANEDPNVTTTYYLFHDVVPVYNIADLSMSLLGFMDAKEHAHLDEVWTTIKQAALHFHAALPRVTLPPWPHTPKYTGVLTSTHHYQRSLRSPRKWRHDIPLVPGQRAALDSAISPTKLSMTDPVEISKLAYDLALPLSYVEHFLQRRQQLAAPKRSKPRALRPSKTPAEQAVWQNLNQHKMTVKQKERMAIRDELSNRIRAAREVYDNRVKACAEAAGISVTPELKDYMVRNRPMKKLGQIATDQELRAIIDSFIRVQRGDAAPRQVATTRFQPSGARVVKKVQPMSKPVGTCATCLGHRPDDDMTTVRRHRHSWTKEEDELLFDGETVVRARNRGNLHRGRPALQQIFPYISEQVLRSRLKKMLEQPGRQAYYNRLEDAYYDIISANRGSAELPDPNPGSQIDFPLRQYIDYVRARVNKSLLRLPVNVEPVAPGRPPAPELMEDVPSLVDLFEWSYLTPEVDGHNQMLEQPHLGEDARLNFISVQSVTVKDVSTAQEAVDHRQAVTRAVLKMIVATPQEVYDMKAATKLLSMPKGEYEPQIAALVNEGVLNRNSQFRTPGRMYSFALSWLQASESHLPADFTKEVEETSEKLEQGVVSWPLVGKHGDLAVLMTMVSNDELDIDVAADEMAMHGFNRLSYNTRSLTDADFECDMLVTRQRRHTARPLPLDPPDPRAFPKPTAWSSSKSADPSHIATVLAAIQHAGPSGIDRLSLSSNTKLPPATVDAALAALASLASADPPPLFWAGYDTARAVAREHWNEWTVAEPTETPSARIAPRRWVDIWGNIIAPDWDRALRSVAGQVMHRPGITEWDLRERMKSVMDRLEMTDVLGYLVDTGVLERTRVGSATGEKGEPLPPVQATGWEEGRGIAYVGSARMWI